MRSLLLSIVIALFASHAIAQSAKTFEVARVSGERNATYSREKLVELFDAIVADKRPPRKRPFRIEIIQNIEPGRFLARFDLRGEYTVFSVTTLKKSVIPDGSTLDLYLVDSGEVYTYISTQGAKRTVSSYLEVPPPAEVPDMTREEFISSLKEGAVYVISINEKERCSKGCFQGKRRGRGNDVGESPDRWFDCPHCSGGFTTSVVTYKVVWLK